MSYYQFIQKEQPPIQKGEKAQYQSKGHSFKILINLTL
jgi:hypothetical protein